MLKVYNGRFETIINPDRLYLETAPSGFRRLIVAKYFGISPSGKPEGVKEEAVRIGIPWLGGAKGLFGDEGKKRAIDNALTGENPRKDLEKLKDHSLFSNDAFGVEGLSELISRSESAPADADELYKLLLEIEKNLDLLMRRLKDAAALEEVLGEEKLAALVDEVVGNFAFELQQKKGIRGAEELLEVEILPFP